MKKIYLLAILGFTSLFSHAQSEQTDSWKISWNKKTILQTGTSNETANIGKIKSADLKKNYVLKLEYNEGDATKERAWIRSFTLVDETGKEIFKKDSTRSLKFTASQLKKLFAGKKQIKIYTIAIPSDPDLAARVRVRRVHLCTLEVQ